MKRALIVGIDSYPSQRSLTGCVADAVALHALLARHADGTPNWDALLITSDNALEITRDSLRRALTRLFGNARDADLLFYFAGHGGQTPWGADLMTQDATTHSLGVSMNDLVTLANDSPARSITIVLDCCFSGDIGNSPGLRAAGVAENFRLDRAVLRENLTIMAASRATEPSQESAGHGVFTRILLEGLDGGATDHRGNVTALSLYGYLSPAFSAWQQRPVLKTSLTEPVVLRVGAPWLDLGMLRDLPRHFPAEDHRLQLTPAHEGDGRPLPPDDRGTFEQQQFDYVGRLRNAHLVTTDDLRDHYWVAMDSGYVYLTPLGRHFWRLADRGIL
ncbi:caspase domain-containing protein [Actinoplanes sp. NPDC051859]|uniref:caspase domain-containing protein n=1 Tax=Actinoplanes sp. NPDC051859 TaxID=3363909 RepID=UPI0037A884B1